jgi:muramoyltetrapeptide carboxypeptidase LdcA involved in peptidoglycan recycling
MLRAVRPPDPVGTGGHIRVVSPGGPLLAHLPERAERAEASLRALGFEVSFSKHAFGMSENGQNSGTPAERASDLLEAFTDPNVDALLISDSGPGSHEVIPLLDPEVMDRVRKPFIGFCDTAYLQHHLAVRHGLGSYYGSSLLVHLGDAPEPLPEAVDYLCQALALESPLEYRPAATRARPLDTWHDPDIESAPRVRDYPGGCICHRRYSLPLTPCESSRTPRCGR